jgi:hypothetical protein
MKEIKLTRGQVAKVCDCHAHLLEGYKWTAQWHKERQTYHAVRYVSVLERVFGGAKSISMHRVIDGTPKGFVTDHIDHDTLNNQCSNLRTATNAQNQYNISKRKNNKSGYKGVQQIGEKKWIATIALGAWAKHLGTFKSPEDAARAYDQAAREHHGEFAKTNF